MKQERDLYKLLGVPRSADAEQIEVAMLKLSEACMTGKTTDVYLDEIKLAYQILSSPYRRAAYDISLEETELKQSPPRPFWTQCLIRWRAWINDVKTQFFKKIIKTDEIINQPVTNRQQSNRLKKLTFRRRQINVDHLLVSNEIVQYRARIHWLLYIEVGALLLIGIPSYLFLDTPAFIVENTPTVSIWLVEKLIGPAFPIWYLGLSGLWIIGLLMLMEVIIIKQTTALVITSKRIIMQIGLFNRKVTELKLTQFESLTIRQSLLGRLFNYGTLTIMGTGGVKLTIPHVVTPYQFERTLWQVLEMHHSQKFIEQLPS